MKKLLFSLLLIGSAFATIPDRFRINERFFALTTTLDLETENEMAFAKARKRFFSLTSCFDLEVPAMPELNAMSAARFFTWGTIVDVADPSGNYIGRIEEQIFQFASWSKYYIFNAQGALVCIGQMNFLGTAFEFRSPLNENILLATIERPFVHFFTDSWTVQIRRENFDEKVIDPRLFILTAIYQTDKDNQRRSTYNAELRDYHLDDDDDD